MTTLHTSCPNPQVSAQHIVQVDSLAMLLINPVMSALLDAHIASPTSTVIKLSVHHVRPLLN